jgi:hypothetical protein
MSNSSSCRPPVGKTYLAIGQDYQSIQEYVMSQYTESIHRQQHLVGSEQQEGLDSISSSSEIHFPVEYFIPSATMVYTDIQTLRGLSHPIDYGSGIEYAKGLAEDYRQSGIQIGLWLNGTKGCLDIVHGRLDRQIVELFDFILVDLPPSVPHVFLRVGYEFDNPWFRYSDSPSTYKLAFIKLVQQCRQQLGYQYCRERVSFVWHSWAAPRVVTDLEDFYPGDEMVDWVGVSIFQQVYPWANGNDAANFAGGNMQQVSEVLDFAKLHKKPIMIAESTPFGGMKVASTKYKNISDGDGDIIWDLWFQKTLDLIEAYDISMWSYINCDWDAQPMWHGVGFGDTRLVTSKVVMNRWWNKVLKNTTRFVHRIENCNRAVADSTSTTAQLPTMNLGGGISIKRDNLALSMVPWAYAIVSVALLGMLLARRLLFDRRQMQTNQSFRSPTTSVRCQTYGSFS